MHRTLEIAVSAAQTDALVQALEGMEHVIGLSVNRGSSIKPPGDVLTVHVLNRGVDDVLRSVEVARQHGRVSVATAELASIIDPDHREAIDSDVDEALWEEMETGLRHQGRITPNYLILMVLGGAVAAVGLVSESAPQAIAFVAASIIAPGFEPIAKIPLGLVLRRWHIVRRGLYSTVAGYLVLMVAAALTFLLLQGIGTVTSETFITNTEVEHLAHPTAREIIVSVCGAIAGVIMVAAYRRSVIAGPVIALILIPAAAMTGVAAAIGEWSLVWEGLERLGLDILLVIVLGGITLFLKQLLVHRRAAIV